MSINPKQVQLRGGSEVEHEEFVGANREVTVDTTNKTLRVHDGVTPGGNKLSTSKELSDESEKINRRIDDIQHNIASSHNHDSLYSKLGHNHDDIYERKISGLATLKSKHVNGYCGMSCESDVSNWIRTTRNGLIPYQSGGYSSLGTSSWRFNDGWFNNLNTKTITVAKNGNTSRIAFPASANDSGYIDHWEDNNTSHMFFSVSDDRCDGDRFYFGSTPGGNWSTSAFLTTDGRFYLTKFLESEWAMIICGGRHIYFNGDKPSDAPDGSISFG